MAKDVLRTYHVREFLAGVEVTAETCSATRRSRHRANEPTPPTASQMRGRPFSCSALATWRRRDRRAAFGKNDFPPGARVGKEG